MRSRTKAVAIVGIIGGLTALSAPAFAATDGNTPDPTGITFSVANPETAALTLSQNAVNLVANGIGANLSAATASPAITTSTSGGKGVQGGVTASVESDDPVGYTLSLNGSAGGLVPVGGGTAIDWFDLNIVTNQVAAGVNGGSFQPTDNHFTAAAGDDPTTNGVTVINSSGVSGGITNGRDNSGASVTPVDPATGETPDILTAAFYVQPKSGMLAGHSYTGTADFTYLGK